MPLRILLITPEPHAREGLQAILATAGHDVTVAEDLGGGFKQLCSAGPFDLLLLDADLPPRQGVLISVLDFLRLARSGHTGTRGILLTSCGDELPRDLPSQGVVAVLEKPVDLPRLRLELEGVEERLRRPGAVLSGLTASSPQRIMAETGKEG